MIEWVMICASGIEEVVPQATRYTRWGLVFGSAALPNPIDIKALSRALRENTVELYVDGRMALSAPALLAPAWGGGFLPPDEAPARDPRRLPVPIDCPRGARLRYRFVSRIGHVLVPAAPATYTPSLVLEGSAP